MQSALKFWKIQLLQIAFLFELIIYFFEVLNAITPNIPYLNRPNWGVLSYSIRKIYTP